MKKLKIILSLTLVSGIISCGSNAKTGDEDDWQVLFNGKDLNDWVVKIHHHEVGDNYANTFRIQDGAIRVDYDDYDEFNERYGICLQRTKIKFLNLEIKNPSMPLLILKGPIKIGNYFVTSLK